MPSKLAITLEKTLQEVEELERTKRNVLGRFSKCLFPWIIETTRDTDDHEFVYRKLNRSNDKKRHSDLLFAVAVRRIRELQRGADGIQNVQANEPRVHQSQYSLSKKGETVSECSVAEDLQGIIEEIIVAETKLRNLADFADPNRVVLSAEHLDICADDLRLVIRDLRQLV